MTATEKPHTDARLLVERWFTLVTPTDRGGMPIDGAVRAGKRVRGHNWTAAVDGLRESVIEPEETRNLNIPFGILAF